MISRRLTALLFSCLLLQAFAQQPTTEHKIGTLLSVHQHQEHTFPNRLWVDVYAGGSALGFQQSRFGQSIGGNIHFLSKNWNHFQLRYNYSDDNFMRGTNVPLQYVSDVSYLYGWLLSRKYFLAEFACGVSGVTGSKRGSENYSVASGYNMDRFTTIGLPLEADVKFMARRYIGIGVAAKANINPQLSYFTIGLELTLNGPN